MIMFIILLYSLKTYCQPDWFVQSWSLSLSIVSALTDIPGVYKIPVRLVLLVM